VWRDSETLWRHALAVTADNATAHHHLGNTLVTLGRHDEALEHLTRAVVLRPEAAVLRFNHGVALAEAGRPGAGRAELERAVELSPDLWEAKVVLANLVRRDGDASRALALFEEGLSGRPALWQMPNLAKSYALALRAYGRAPGRTLEEALAVYRAALVLRPDWLEVSTELAWILATHPEATPEHGAEAVELASAAARATDDRSYFELDKLAAAYAAAGRFDEAIEVGERALALARAAGSAVALRRLGERLALYRAGERFREEP
jgi:tetratricopeptide (TPR) repeat protein